MSMGAPLTFVSIQDVPTSGWPASGSSVEGVKMRSSARQIFDEDRFAEVELRCDGLTLFFAKTGCVEDDAKRVAEAAICIGEDTEDVDGDHEGV
jgi:hypothetical protein